MQASPLLKLESAYAISPFSSVPRYPLFNTDGDGDAVGDELVVGEGDAVLVEPALGEGDGEVEARTRMLTEVVASR